MSINEENKGLTLEDVVHVAQLANLTLSEKLLLKFRVQLSSVLGYMSKIKKLHTENVPETAQVTGLENIFREDQVDRKRMFTQEESLANAKRVHDGYFVVDAIFKD